MDMKEATQQFCKIDQEVHPLPKPIFGLPCHDSCSDGTFATVDLVKRKMMC